MEYIKQFSTKNRLNISSYNTNKPVYWEHPCPNCDKTHIWKTSISQRKTGSGCPYCSGRVTCECKSISVTFPEIIKEWHPDNKISPKEISKGSNKKIKWKCIKNHEWIATPNDRTNRKTGCPYCSNRKLNDENNLKVVYPEISKSWNFQRNCINPTDVFPSSPKKVWWLCEKGHEWESTVNNRLTRGCPYCTKNRLLPDKSNSIFYTHKDLMKDWYYGKNCISPKDITFGMSKKIWWLCEKGHEWESTINNRTSGNNCPYCRESKGEKEIEEYLKTKNIEHKRQYIIKYGEFKRLYIDFYIPEYKLAIEYDGVQHFEPVKHFGGKPKFDKQVLIDKTKESYCKENKINLLKIHYKDKQDIPYLIENMLSISNLHIFYYSHHYFE